MIERDSLPKRESGLEWESWPREIVDPDEPADPTEKADQCASLYQRIRWLRSRRPISYCSFFDRINLIWSFFTNSYKKKKFSLHFFTVKAGCLLSYCRLLLFQEFFFLSIAIWDEWISATFFDHKQNEKLDFLISLFPLTANFCFINRYITAGPWIISIHGFWIFELKHVYPGIYENGFSSISCFHGKQGAPGRKWDWSQSVDSR